MACGLEFEGSSLNLGYLFGGSFQGTTVLSREWGHGLLGLLKGTLRDYHRDPFPHSLARTREIRVQGLRVSIGVILSIKVPFSVPQHSRARL